MIIKQGSPPKVYPHFLQPFTFSSNCITFAAGSGFGKHVLVDEEEKGHDEGLGGFDLGTCLGPGPRVIHLPRLVAVILVK